jgi:fructokinase
MSQIYGSIEAGGTKFVCAVGAGPDDIKDEIRFPTTTPKETIGKAIQFFQRQSEPIQAIGIGSFGPIDPNPKSPTYGYITTTPKPGWSNTDVVGTVRATLEIPVGFDTDVNAAALGEHLWGAAQEVDTFVYLTIGTGIGGGVMIDGKLLHGLMHPEMGHIHLPHDRKQDPFGCTCPYHSDCLEGLAAGPAIEARWGQKAETIPEDHPAWKLEAHYLALGLVNIIATLSPQKIIMGGGVMQKDHLFQMVRGEVQILLNKYIQVPEILDKIDTYIIPPALGGRAGILGSMVLAQRARILGNIGVT